MEHPKHNCTQVQVSAVADRLCNVLCYATVLQTSVINFTMDKDSNICNGQCTVGRGKKTYKALVKPSKKKRTQRCERQLLLGLISICAGEKFIFKVTFKTIHTSCSPAVKKQVIPDLWRTNRKCFVSHDKRCVKRAKQLFV